MGTNMLVELFDEKYYRNLNGGILAAFGILFSRDLKIYLYPWFDENTNTLYTTENCPIHPRLQPLFRYMVDNKRIVDIAEYNPDVLSIYSRDALDRIHNGHGGWEEMVPTYVDTLIKENKLFGYDPEQTPNPDYTPTERTKWSESLNSN
jgi:hypothetical protein